MNDASRPDYARADETISAKARELVEELKKATTALELDHSTWWRFGKKFKAARRRVSDAMIKLSDHMEWNKEDPSVFPVAKQAIDDAYKVFLRYGGG